MARKAALKDIVYLKKIIPQSFVPVTNEAFYILKNILFCQYNISYHNLNFYQRVFRKCEAK